MGLQPNIKRKNSFTFKTCSKCGQIYGPENFAPSRSFFYNDGYLPICNDCIEDILKENDYDWKIIDKVCQYADIPFVPKEWEKLREMDEVNVFSRYAAIFMGDEYLNLGWDDYYKAYRELQSKKKLERELPGLGDEELERLKSIWGKNYSQEELEYLENLFNGLLATQNVNGSLQIDQARKICKMSLEIDSRIRDGGDFDKILKSYDTLVKSAEFTPKNVKNLNDFDTFGEAIKWMEKNGWKNKFYDRVTRDVVDESMKNFESFNQRLYINESNMAEEINRRIEALKNTHEMENYYGTKSEYDLDQFEQEGYDKLMLAGDDDDFAADIDTVEDEEDE